MLLQLVLFGLHLAWLWAVVLRSRVMQDGVHPAESLSSSSLGQSAVHQSHNTVHFLCCILSEIVFPSMSRKRLLHSQMMYSLRGVMAFPVEATSV
jgi:hypothetical protein